MNLLAAPGSLPSGFAPTALMSVAVQTAPASSRGPGGPASSGAPGAAPPAKATMPPLLLDRVRRALHDRHYSARTEAATIEWLQRFFAFHAGRAPEAMGEPEVRAFLGDLAARPEVSVPARNQARAAVLLLFHGVLGQRFNCTDDLARPQADGRGPVALSRDEVKGLLAKVDPASALLVSLLYGSGLRVAEACMLRVRDVDLEARVLHVRGGRERGPEARRVMLPASLVQPLRQHLAAAQARHREELARDAGAVVIPEAARLAEPGATRSWAWQWLFPAARMMRDPVSGEGRRSHQHEAVVQRAVQTAARGAGIAQAVNAHTLRHCFTVHLLDDGCQLQTVQMLLGVVAGEAPQAPVLPRSPLDL
jgi:integron integrase